MINMSQALPVTQDRLIALISVCTYFFHEVKYYIGISGNLLHQHHKKRRIFGLQVRFWSEPFCSVERFTAEMNRTDRLRSTQLRPAGGVD